MIRWVNGPVAARCDHRSLNCGQEVHTVDGRDLCLYHWGEIRCAYECAEVYERCLDYVRAEIDRLEKHYESQYVRETSRIAQFLAERMIDLREWIENPCREIPTFTGSWEIGDHAPGMIISSKQRVNSAGKSYGFNHEIIGYSRRATGKSARINDNERFR